MRKKLHPEVQKLLLEIEAHMRATGTKRTMFGLRAAGDGHFIARLEQGRKPTLETIDKVRAYLKEEASK